MKKIAVLTGSGISAESGLQTFRDNNGLWNSYRVEEVASPQAWQQNPSLVLQFYNERRKKMMEATPNAAHYSLVALEGQYHVTIITQNIDNLHERAGSQKIIHLHGELSKARSTADPTLIYTIQGSELKLGSLCEKGSQLRPHVVWFGEHVSLFEEATEIIMQSDILIIVGTSLTVYPAAELIHFSSPSTLIYLVDPVRIPIQHRHPIQQITQNATTGLPYLIRNLLTQPNHE